MIVLDACVLIAHLSSRDEHHRAASQLLAAQAAADFAMHTLTLSEVLVGPARSGRITLVEHSISALGIKEWAPEPGSALRLAVLRAETGLRLPDCAVLDAALSTQAALATFDDRLRREAAALGVRVLPE
jgi:predicted nucleic acid-binding protein